MAFVHALAAAALALAVACGPAPGGAQSRAALPLPPSVSNGDRVIGPTGAVHIVVRKAARTLELYRGGAVSRAYKVGLGFSPDGDKAVEGDGRTPEGDYFVFVKNPKSSYYLSLGVSYPNAEDAARGLRDGLITRAQHDAIVAAQRALRMPPQTTRLGGLIYIHGHGSSSDWTLGCVALDDADMKELYDAVEPGTPVTILP